MSRIIQGDSLTVLKTLESESIDCCITSPPYWGLRDYGTAKWEGGGEDCEHKERLTNAQRDTSGGFTGRDKGTRGEQGYAKASGGLQQFRNTCGKCGAIRIDSQIGLEKTPEEYVAKMVEVFREVKRVLKKEGTCWLNLGDSYVSAKSRYSSVEQTIAGHSRNEPISGNRPDLKGHSFLKDKDLCGIPWRVAFALQQDGWYLRQDIIWHKPNPMPESVTDRCTKAHEYIFLLSKSPKYYFDNVAIAEPANYDGRKDTFFKGGVKYKNHQQQTMLSRGHERWPMRGFKTKEQIDNPQPHGKDIETYPLRNKRSVWTVTTKPFKGAHFATFPEDLILPCVLAGCPKDGVILDPFFGAGTTGVVAKKNNRNYIGIELNPKYIEMAQRRINNTMGTML